jgi:membrane associated rhomboid family serine protease
VTDLAPPPDASPPPGPAPLALAIAHDLVTRYRLRLVDARDSRLGDLGQSYELAAAMWTGPRAALVAFYEPPPDPAEAGRDLAARCEAARRWGRERLQVQSAQVCDILIVALRPVSGGLMASTDPADPVRLGAAWVDMASGDAGVLLPIPPGLPTLSELRAKARAVRDGSPVPTLAAVDLAERQTVAGGYTAPVRRAMVTQPVVTYGLIAAFVLIYLLEKANLNVVFGGALPNGSDVFPGAGPSQWWRYVSSAFLHDPGSFLHVAFNSLAMLWIGRLVEQLYGRLVLLGTFLITAVLGALVWVLAGDLGLAAHTYSVGASGGISGLVGLLLMLGRVQGRDVPVGIAHGVRNYAVIVIVLNVVFGFSGGLFAGGATVNNWVHGGSLVAGALVGLVLPPVQRIGGRDLTQVERIVLGAAIAAGALALILAAYNIATLPPLLAGPSPG